MLINVTKRSLFTVDERVEMLGQVTSRYGNVRIERFHGLLVDFCANNGITAVIKGLRAVSDFEYEMPIAQMNHRMGRRRDAVHHHQPALLAPRLQPGKEDHQVRGGRRQARPRGRPHPAPRAPRRQPPDPRPRRLRHRDGGEGAEENAWPAVESGCRAPRMRALHSLWIRLYNETRCHTLFTHTHAPRDLVLDARLLGRRAGSALDPEDDRSPRGPTTLHIELIGARKGRRRT